MPPVNLPSRRRRGLPSPSNILETDNLNLNLPAPSTEHPAILPHEKIPPRTARTSTLFARQDSSDSDSDVIIPSEYGSLDNSLAPAAIAGIVLGSVAGFLLLLWIVYWCLNIGPPVRDYRSDYGASRVTVSRGPSRTRRHSHSHSHSHSHGDRSRHHHRRRSRRHSSARPRGGGTGDGPIIVDAPPPPPPPGGAVPMMERTRSVSRARPPPPPPPPPGDDEDEVVVIEENSPPPSTSWSRSRRYSSERSYRRDY